MRKLFIDRLVDSTDLTVCRRFNCDSGEIVPLTHALVYVVVQSMLTLSMTTDQPAWQLTAHAELSLDVWRHAESSSDSIRFQYTKRNKRNPKEQILIYRWAMDVRM